MPDSERERRVEELHSAALQWDAGVKGFGQICRVQKRFLFPRREHRAVLEQQDVRKHGHDFLHVMRHENERG